MANQEMRMNPVQKQPVEPDKQQDDDAVDKDALQGEGNYDAARRHRKSVEDFVESGDVERSARDAAPRSDEEADALREAEEQGRAPAKG
jgi:hypothetical protein